MIKRLRGKKRLSEDSAAPFFFLLLILGPHFYPFQPPLPPFPAFRQFVREIISPRICAVFPPKLCIIGSSMAILPRRTTLAEHAPRRFAPDPFHNVTSGAAETESWGLAAELHRAGIRRRISQILTAWASRLRSHPLSLIASGTNGDDATWTRRLLDELVRNGNRKCARSTACLHHYAWEYQARRTQEWFEGQRGRLTFDPSTGTNFSAKAKRNGIHDQQSTGKLWPRKIPTHSIKFVVEKGPVVSPAAKQLRRVFSRK